MCIANLSPVPREGYRVGLPRRRALGGAAEHRLDATTAARGVGNIGAVRAEKHAWHEQPFSAEVTLPPLGVVWLRPSTT